MQNGNSVADGLVHVLYPQHPTRDTPRRVRTPRALEAVAGPNPTHCDVCYPEVKRERSKAVSRPSTRRSLPNRESDESVEVPQLRSREATPEGEVQAPPDGSPAGLRRAAPQDASEGDPSGE